MAEINIAASGKIPGVRRSKKLSTRVDLTPMVDLGFLLITFFVFTTKMGEPQSLDLKMPKESNDSTKVPMSTALSVFPLSGGKIFYYHGKWEDALKSSAYGITSYSYSEGIGQVIRNKKAAMESQEKGFSRKLFLVIKPAEESSYGHLVDLMDEVIINDLHHYAITGISEEEKELIIKVNGSL
jgi:hypothetical protein